jgi:hypothetical protein
LASGFTIRGIFRISNKQQLTMEYQDKLRHSTVLRAPANYGLLEIFEILKWGRKALDQNLLDNFCQQVKDAYEKAEKEESPDFDAEFERLEEHLPEGELSEPKSPESQEPQLDQPEEKTEDNE